MPTLRITDLSPAQFARRVPRALGVASSSLFRISLCVLLLFQNLALATAQTVPTGGRVVGGQAAISAPSPGQLSITQTSNRAIIDWNSFSVGPGASVTFQQPGAGAAMLNRVTGATTSEIAGAIKGNGQVFLINPNGIAITPSGTVDTGAFLGSSLDMANEDFMAGRLKFRGSGESGSVSNAGRITTGTGGYAALLGADVNNSGTISSPLGRVALGSGESATLDLEGDGFLQVAIPTRGKSSKPLIENSGKISADGGRVELRAATARDAVRNVVNMPGSISARSVSSRNGVIVIDGGQGGDVRVSGRVAARGKADAAGGSIKITGDKVALDKARILAGSRVAKGGDVEVSGRQLALRGTTIDASGATGGGKIRIGGDFKGRGTIAPSESTVVEDTNLTANSNVSGDAGSVVVWSDGATRFSGVITARALGVSGNGGDAEVSGKQKLVYDGLTDLRAANGRTGTLLLDPYNVTISTGADTGGFTAAADDTIINVTTLQTALATANVEISTGSGGAQAGDITVANALTWSSGNLLTLTATGSIAINASITALGGGLALSGSSYSLKTTNIQAASLAFANTNDIALTGAVTLNIAGDLTLNNRLTGAGGLTKSGTNALTLGGDNTFSGAVNVFGGDLILTSSTALGVGAKNIVQAAGVGKIRLQNNITLAAGINFHVSGAVLISDSGSNTINGNISSGSGAGQGVVTVHSGLLTLNGNLTNGSSRRAIELAGAGAGIVNGAITDGATILDLVKSGTGTWTLNGPLTYTGYTSVNGGLLKISGQPYFNIGRATSISTGATLELYNSNNTSTGLLPVSSIGGAGTLAFSGNTTFVQPTGGDFSTRLTLAMTGGLIDLRDTSVLTNGGWRFIDWTNNRSALNIASGATFDVSDGNTVNVSALTGSGTLTKGIGAGAVTLNVGVNNGGGTFSGVIEAGAGPINLVKLGTGTQILTGANTYTGTTTISGGKLQIGDGGATGTLGTGDVINNASLVFNRSNDISVANLISGSGSLTKNGGGTLTLSGANTYAGATTISAGELSVLNTSTTSALGKLGAGAVSIAAGATLSFNNASTVENSYMVTNVISGAGSVRLSGPDGSTTTLSAANTYAGGTTISSGTVNIYHNSALGTGTVTMTGGALRATATRRTVANNFILSGTIGFGSQTDITGAITLAGDTTITASRNAGASTWSGAIDLGSFTLGTGDVGPNTFGSSWAGQALTLSGAISGAGGITQGSIGSLVLSGANSYAGATTVNTGLLRAGSTSAFGNNSAVTIGATGILELGGFSNSIGSLAGLAGASVTNAGAAATLTTGGDDSSTTYAGILKNGTGTLTLVKTGSGTQILTGANTYTGTTTISAGTLQIGNGGATGSLGAGAVINNANLAYLFGSTTSVATPQNYSGTGNLSLTAGMVWFPANLNVGGNLSINSTTPSVAWGTLQTNVNPVLTVGGTTSITGYLAGRSAGGNTLTINSTGAITLDNITNGIAGSFWNWGTLNLNAGTSAINITGNNLMSQNNTSATWNLTGAVNISGNVSHAFGGTQTLNINDTGDSSISGNLASNVRLVKSGANTLTLSGANTHTGTTTINGGTLKAGSTSALSSSSAVTVGATGTLDLAGFSNTIGSLAGVVGGVVTNSGAAATLTTGGANTSTTYAGALQDGAGALGLAKVGTGTLTLTGTNTHSGGTNASAGTLSANINVSQNAIGAGAVNIDAGATLKLNSLNTSSSNVTLGNSFTGAGTLNVAFATGNTVRNTILSNLAGFAGNISLTAAGSTGDKLTLASDVGGSVSIGNGTTLFVSATARTVANGVSVTGAGSAEGKGALRIDGGGTLNANVALTGNATLGAHSIGGGTLNGVISGNFNIAKNGTSGLILLGDNSYTGTTTVSGGTLQIGNGGTTGTLGAGAVINNSNLTFSRSDSLTVANAISGVGTLTKVGAGATTLTGANTYTGATTISAGALALGPTGSLNVGAGTLTVSVADGASFTGSGVVTAGTLSYSGLGAISLTGNNAVNTLTASGTTGALTYNSVVQLAVNAIATNGSAVAITSTIADSASANNALTINGAITTNGGDIALTGTAAGSGWGVRNSGALSAGAGSVTLVGTSRGNNGVLLSNNITTTTGNISVQGTTTSGGIGVGGGVNPQLTTTDGDISVSGQATGGYGIRLNSFSATSTGLGDIAIDSTGQLLFCSGGGCAGRLTVNLSANQGSVSITGNSLINFGNVDANISSASNQVTIDGSNISFSNDSIVSIGNGSASTISDAISGSGALIKSGTGTLTLTGANSYTGTTTISGGGLQIGDGGSTGTLGTGAVVNNGSLVFNRSNAFTVANAISGSGELTKLGAGTLTLTSANTYAGTTTISGGVLQIGDGGTTGSLGTGAVIDDASLVFNLSNDFTVANAISGTGALTKLGAGTLTLTGANTYAGATTISAGVLRVGDGGSTGSLGSGDVDNNAVLRFDRSDDVTIANVVTGSGDIVARAGGLTIIGAWTAGAIELTATAGSIAVNNAISASSVQLSATGDIAQGPSGPFNVALLSAQAGGNISLGAVGNNIATFAAMAGGAVDLVASGDLAVGLVNGVTGVSAGGAVSIVATGALDIQQAVVTTDASANALLLAAGDGTAAGTSTGGDISITASGGVQVGAGGQARLYTGSLAGSAGLATAGTAGGFRYGSNRTTQAYTRALLAGVNVIYREQPTLIFNPDTGGVTTRTYDGTETNVSLLASNALNGDIVDPISVTAKNAGVYNLSTGVTSDLGYAIAPAAVEYVITPRSLTVTADAQARTYGDANPSLTYSVSGLVAGDTLSGGLTTSAVERSNVGNYAIVQGSLAASSNYNLAYVGANLVVSARSVTVTADAQSRVYGAANPALTYVAAGLLSGDTLSGGLQTTATSASGVGDYDIARGTLANDNYAISYLGAKLSITPRALTVTADAKSRVYGDANPALTYTTNGLVNGDVLTGGLQTAALTTSGVGDYDIARGTLANDNYAISYLGAKLSITQRALTVTADAKSRVYGDANPALTYTTNGLVNGDVLTGGLQTAALTTSGVGDYDIARGTLANDNYAIAYSGAKLSVTQRALTVTADAKSRVYGDANPALTYTTNGLVNGDVLTGGLQTAAQTTSGVGDYDIDRGTLANGNYAIFYAGAKLSVTQRNLTVAADAASRVYGDANPALTYATSGLVNGDTLTGTLDVKADERSNVGAYAIHLGSLAASSNYKLTYRGADLTVTQRALSVTADAKSRIYGDANPALTYSATGLVNGDSLTGALSTPADERSGVGVYAITRGSLASSANYAMSFTGADLEIARRALAVQAQAQSRVYGDANPPLTYVATGLVNGDTLTGELASDATISSSIGSYAITRGSLASQNYAIDFTGAQLSVTPRQLVISADNILKQLGVALTFTGREFSTSGLALSDRVDSVSLSSEGAAIGAASGPNLTAAHYAINISNPKGENLTNYAITLKPGILSVLPDLLGPPVWPSVFVVAPSLSAPSIEPTAARATSIRWEPSSKFDTLYGSGIRIDEIDGQVIISR